MTTIAAAALAACAHATNFTDPDAPRYGTPNPAHVLADTLATPAGLTIVTFNIKYGREVERALEVLQQEPLRNADVISLQEVDARGAERIASALGMAWVYYPAAIHPLDEREFGPAVLARWPIERDWKLALPHYSWTRRQQRTATAAVLRVGSRRVQVYAVHLELPLGITPAARREQVERIMCDAWDATGPVVIAGDFNGPDVAYLFEDAGYQWTTRHIGPTAAFLRLDHIFSRGFDPTEVREAGVVAEVRDASDHRPVWAALRFTGDSIPKPARAARPAHCSAP
jgi:endonuclease/exonuclease/phosphatase family metal-dependent hydrolase